MTIKPEEKWFSRVGSFELGISFLRDPPDGLPLRSREQSLVHDFATDLPGQAPVAVWTRYEGSPSLDGRYWGFMAQDPDWRTVDLLVYDQVEDRVIATRDMRGISELEREIDAVTISPLGNYFLACHDEYCESGQTGDEAHPCGLMV